jgi:hypothetical protein
MATFRPYLEQEAELAKLERISRIRTLNDAEADRYAELVYRAQRRGFRLYNRRAGASAFARRERAA